ncbi:hypothetical protein ACIBCN_39565 [Nocardia sp. NPDC051052]|uniref:hypothetical protein n=1 Tax=Nocardia sp. NPDC051052 TaxID=3364322 RepID=UPI003799196C
MTAATLPPPAAHRPAENRPPTVSAITRIQNAVCALPAPTLPHDSVAATTVNDLATIDIIDAHTLAVVARRDRHIQPIATMITHHLAGVSVTVIHSAITVTID